MISKELKRYRKFQKRYLKQLIKLAKADRCWDWSYMYDILLHMLKGRLEYYNNGDNVWQAEDSLKEIIQSLTKAIELLEYAYDDTNFMFEDIIIYFENNEHIDYSKVPSHTRDEYIEMHSKQQKAYEDAFKYIGEHIRGWWD